MVVPQGLRLIEPLALGTFEEGIEVGDGNGTSF